MYRKEPIVTNTLIRLCISPAHVESAFVDRLEPDTPPGGRRSSRAGHAWGPLWREEVLHA